MPAGDGVAIGGWDGFVRANESTPWVEHGLSVWELSVNSKPRIKANDDYSKRTSTPDGTPTSNCTYVEAILRPWSERAEWAKAKRAEKVWRDVRALGLDEIEAWLEAAPITWAWLSERFGLSPYGLCTGETWWRQWAAATKPELTPEVVLAGRAEAAEDLKHRLVSPGFVTTIAGASKYELCAFIAAVAVKLGQQGEGQILARLAFVHEVSTWRMLAASSEPLILVPCTPDLEREIPSSSVHSVCVPVESSARADVTVPALGAAEVAAALGNAGVTELEKADALGRLARRSLTGLRRSLAAKAALHRPAWADKNSSRNVRSILLAGSWREDVDGDRSILETLTGVGYEHFREAVSGTADSPTDPLIICTYEAWHLVSAEDAWMLLASKLTLDDMEKFKIVVEKVLMEVDPALGLSRDQRWRAVFDGRTRCYSDELRRGLAQSLALLGINGGAVGWSRGVSGLDFVKEIIRKLFEWALADRTGKAWQSLADVFPLLAEADPDTFLEAVDAATAGDKPLLVTMVDDNTEDFFILSGRSPHRRLLESLERVACSTEHFGHAVSLLARLSGLDLDGRMSCGAADSLAAIYRPTYPCNSVDPERRITVLDTLRQRYPDVAWELEISMLPTGEKTLIPIKTLAFRTWKPDEHVVTFGELRKITTAAVERCIEDAGEDAQRWSKILSCSSAMSKADRGRVVVALETMAKQADVSTDFQYTVWRTLVELIGRHRKFAGSSWALPDKEISKLDALASCYQPKSSYLRLVRLFQSWTPYIGVHRPGDHKGFERELKRQRIAAIQEIEAEGGFGAVTRLARDASVPIFVGAVLADVGLTHDEEVLAWLVYDDQNLVDAATVYFSDRYRLEGFKFIADLFERDDLTVDQRACLLLAVSDDLPQVWALAAREPELDARYWAAFPTQGLGQDFDKLDEVAARLVQAGRYADVLYLISIYSDREKIRQCPQTAKLTVRALYGHLADPIQSAAARNLSAYNFEQLLAYLEVMREHLDPGDLLRLEWLYLPVLDYDAKVPTLSESLATDPRQFVEVVCAVYSAQTKYEDEKLAEDQGGGRHYDASASRNASSLLSVWDSPPGLVDGVMNAELLRFWIDSAVDLLAERGRTAVGLQHVGQVLWHSPPDDDGLWPGCVVRDLFEEERLDHLEEGFYLKILNSRGVSSCGLEEGGEQELELAEQYRAKAQLFADDAPRVARIFKRVAENYEREARREEEDAERFRRGLQ